MTKLTAVLNKVIDEAFSIAGSRRVKDVLPLLTVGNLRRRWRADERSAVAIEREGLSQAIRKRGKGNLSFVDDEGEGDELSLPLQSTLWPESLREMFLRMNRRSVTVPGKGLVPVVPGLISGADLMAAAEFLEMKGKQTTDVAKRVRWFAQAVLKDEEERGGKAA